MSVGSEIYCREDDQCSNEQCLRIVQTIYVAPIVFISVTMLVGILVDEQFGWGNIFERVRSSLSWSTHEMVEEDIELADVNQQGNEEQHHQGIVQGQVGNENHSESEVKFETLF